MQLFIDAGNSRIKYTENNQPFQIHSTSHEYLAPLLTALQTKPYTEILITSGRSITAKKTVECITQKAKEQSIKFSKIVVKPHLLTVNYADISQFGTDRFLNLLAAKKRYTENFCVVSCGTAITLDFYTNKHIGGMILPGLTTAITLLKEKTGLDNIEKPKQLLGNDTASSIGAGLYHGLQNLIYSSVSNIENAYNKKMEVLLTGGNASVLYDRGVLIESLLFEGMLIYQTATAEPLL